MSLHSIDRLDVKMSNYDMDRLMVFCLLDRAQQYEKVCKTFDYLDNMNLTTRQGLKSVPLNELQYHLRRIGYRFPNQTAIYLKEFSCNDINLKVCTREELVKKVKGIGYKLASMFLRNTRGKDYAVLDVHIKRWLKNKGYKFRNYIEAEGIFRKLAKDMNMSIYDLDMKIWQENRRGK